MATDKAWYVFRYYARFMTKEEHLAHRHLVGTAKAMRGMTDVASQTEARKNARPVYRDVLSNDHDVLGLTSEGLDAFVERVAQRILGDHRHEVGFNNCPKCGALARTPKARQCRFCGFDWHGNQ